MIVKSRISCRTSSRFAIRIFPPRHFPKPHVCDVARDLWARHRLRRYRADWRSPIPRRRDLQHPASGEHRSRITIACALHCDARARRARKRYRRSQRAAKRDRIGQAIRQGRDRWRRQRQHIDAIGSFHKHHAYRRQFYDARVVAPGDSRACSRFLAVLRTADSEP